MEHSPFVSVLRQGNSCALIKGFSVAVYPDRFVSVLSVGLACFCRFFGVKEALVGNIY